MDEIQKVLIKQGRKDLAQEYYLKVAKKGKLSGEDLDTFQTIADDAGGKLYRGYSGRGMYGETCIGITGDATNIIEQAGAQGIKGARTDSMGLQDIVYWPNYPDDQGEEREAKKAGHPWPKNVKEEDDEDEEDALEWLNKNAEKSYGRGAYKVTGKFIYAAQFKDFKAMKKALEGKKFSTISVYSGGSEESVAIVFGTVERSGDVKFGDGRFTLKPADAEWSTVSANGCLMHLGNYIIALDDD